MKRDIQCLIEDVEELFGNPAEVAWMKEANCQGIETKLFFPPRGDAATAQNARAVCDACRVSTECAEYAIIHNIRHGIWGGTGDRQRRVIRKTRRESVA